ncbi:MAG: hypothetical protein GX946_11825 [Oligosphaeraceae bacterium]|nr:hypothetical protein [Oligosphaeraceae bacterium]
MRNFFFCLSLLALSLSAATTAEQLFQTAILPGAQQYFYSDDAALRANPLLSSLMSAEKSSDGLYSLPSSMAALFNMLKKAEAMELPVVKRSQLSIDWAGVLANPAALKKNLRYLAVLELDRLLPAQDIAAFIGKEAELIKQMGLECVFDGELNMLRIADNKEPDASVLGVAFFDDAELLMLAPPELLSNIIVRVRNGLPVAAVSEKLLEAKAQVPADRQFYMLLLPDDNFQAAIQEQAPDVPATQMMEELNTVCFSLQAAEKLNLQLSMEFNNENNAASGKAMIIDGFIMGMLRMYITQQLGAELPMLQTMESSLQGKQAIFTCALGAEDFKLLIPFFQQISKSMVERFGP